MNVAAKNVDDSMLNFFGYLKEIHIIPAASRALHQQFVAIILIEPLDALNEQKVHR